MIDYERLKELAKRTRQPITDLIALAPQNDPFYTGTPQEKVLGAWFRDLWEAFGFTTGVHIRRMHYAIVSQNPPIRFPDGTPYENTERCWDKLSAAAKAARYLEYVDPAAFVDRRNDDPKIYQDFDTTRDAWVDVSEVGELGDIDIPTLPEVPHYDMYGFRSPQRYHLEIWCEKSTMNDILEPLVEQYQATLLFGKGELSITAALQAIRRFEKSDKPVRIFYVSDFDPAGAGMPVSMARKLEYFVSKLDIDLDIKLFPVVLTHQQTREYTRLLPTPIKDSERRKANFEAKYGGGAVELDALEALYPGELRRVLSREMNRYYDTTLTKRLREYQARIYNDLKQIEGEIRASYRTRIEEIEREEEAIKAAFLDQLGTHIQKRRELWQAIKDELDSHQPYIYDADTPEAVIADERPGALYDSSRDYLTQNEVYQAHKKNMSYEGE